MRADGTVNPRNLHSMASVTGIVERKGDVVTTVDADDTDVKARCLGVAGTMTDDSTMCIFHAH